VDCRRPHQTFCYRAPPRRQPPRNPHPAIRRWKVLADSAPADGRSSRPLEGPHAYRIERRMEGSPSLPHRARSLGPAPPAPHHTVVVFLPMPPPFSFPCCCRRCTPIRRVLPLLSIAGQLSFSPPGFTSANEPCLRRRLLGPVGSSSPTRSHPIHQPRSRVPLPLRTLSSSSFVAAGTSFEKLELATAGAADGKRSINLMDHGRYGAAHPRAAVSLRWRMPLPWSHGSSTLRCACTPAVVTLTTWASTPTTIGRGYRYS
jgi:hypothetical protein